MINSEIRIYDAPPADKKEILRYASVADGSDAVLSLHEECLAITLPAVSYKLCFAKISPEDEYGKAIFSAPELSDYLSGCEGAVIFGATLGIEIDRLIAKYGKIAPSKALLIQAIGAERIEAICDEFCREQSEILEKRGFSAMKRISPGYGKFPLSAQKKLFSLMDFGGKIGLTLNESLLMSPSKSVTAIFGFKRI